MATLRAGVIIYTDAELEAYLLGLSAVGYVDLVQALRMGRPFPELYRSGVRYTREPPGSEVWQIPRGSMASKKADCEDLAAGWRVPELWLAGETRARPYVKRVNPRLRHVQVQRGDGSIEDPSVVLGMHGAEAAAAARASLRPVVPTPDFPLPLLPRAKDVA